MCARLDPARGHRRHLTEINVTSSTGIRANGRFDGPDVAAKIRDVICPLRQAADNDRANRPWNGSNFNETSY
jgi:hypothetical protein